MRLRASFVFVFGALAAVAVAACSGGGGSSGSPPALHPSPNVAVGSPLPAPVSQSVSIASSNGGSNASPAIMNTPIPAPTGYTSTLTVPTAYIPSGTTIAITSGSTLPTSVSLPSLSSARRGAQSRSVRIPQANSGYSAIFYDTLVPSAAITVAGSISVTQAFPAGILVPGQMYYLGFYDSTAPNPAWQTIGSAKPDSSDLTLTFSGAADSTTLQQNQLYGFAIFSVAGSAGTPPPAPPLLAYLPQGANGIVAVTASGTTVASLAVPSNALGLDDAGNVYALRIQPIPSAAPGASASPTRPPTTVAEYNAGSSTASKTYTPSMPIEYFVATSGSGEVAVFGNAVASDTSPTGAVQNTDIWDAGSAGGAPSRTISESTYGVPFGILDHAGNFYATHVNADGSFQYNIYAPGQSVPSSHINETYLTTTQQQGFNPNYAAVGPDGTLYVTEFTFTNIAGQSDPLAGLYIYKPTGGGNYSETFVATTSDANGPGPQGVDVDASGNIYVANMNSVTQLDQYGNYLGKTDDSLHDITVYAPGGTSVLRHITGTASDLFEAVPLAVAADGTLFFSSFGNPDGTGTTASYAVAAGTSTVTQVASNPAELFALYDGSRETTGLHRRTAASASAGGSTHGGIGPHGHLFARAAMEQLRRQGALRRFGPFGNR